MFIAEKGSVLLVEKLRGTLASNGCTGEKIEDEVANQSINNVGTLPWESWGSFIYIRTHNS